MRLDPQAAGAARRALMLDDSDDADLHVVPLVPAVEVVVVHRADPRLEQSGRQDFLVNILRSELQAAFALMEHRERWWTEGLHNAESFVGMEMDRVRASEHNTAQKMNSQMTTLVETLRATQGRAEQSSLAVIDQQRIANDLELYANKLTAQGRAMINNSEQKHWSIVTELAQVRSDLARVETEAERKIRVTLMECESHVHGLELSARAADVRTHLVYNEYCSAKTEADELSASRLTFGLETQIAIESIRGAAADMEMRLRAESQQTRRELLAYEEGANRDTNKMESVATLQEVLKQAQTAWSTADAESRILKSERIELDERVKALRIELGVVTKLEADGRRDAASFIDLQASLVQAKLSSVQVEFVTERTKVSELNSELTAASNFANGMSSATSSFGRELEITTSCPRRKIRPPDDSFNRTSMRENRLGRHRHELDPGNRGPQVRTSGILWVHHHNHKQTPRPLRLRSSRRPRG